MRNLALGLALVASGLGHVGCSAAMMQGLAAGLAEAGNGYSAAGAKLMLFGGPGHDVYLGCVSCSEYASDSVFNEFGAHGSAYRHESIYNRVGPYGSVISQYSVCNTLASDPPVIVDESGGFHGRLTVNPYNLQRTNSDALRQLAAIVCAD